MLPFVELAGPAGVSWSMDAPFAGDEVTHDGSGQYGLGLGAPPAGYQRINARAWKVESDEMRTVGVRDVVLSQHHVSDKLERNVAIHLLDRGGYATQQEIATAFGLTRTQVNRLCVAAARGGLGALVRKERSDKTPEAIAQRICLLREEGHTLSGIAGRVGVSARTVYSILSERGYDPHDRPSSVQLDLSVDGDCPEEAQEAGEAEPGSDTADTTEDMLDRPEATDTTEGVLDKPEADVEFEDAQGVWGAGVLLAVAQEGGGLLQEARGVYGRLRRGTYGLRALVQGTFVMALLGVKSAEALKAEAPDGLGRLLGLSRIFEVKTLRRKLKEIGGTGKAVDWYLAMAKRWVDESSDEIGTLYVDGHTRAYYGKRPIAKGWCARRRLCQPATTDTWTNDSQGRPLLRITHEAHPTVAQVLPEVLADVRKLVDSARLTVAFDRGGWSASTFNKIVAEGFDFVTYRPGHHAPLPAEAFVDWPASDGDETKVWKLADTHLMVRGYGQARLIVMLADSGKQTPIVTSNLQAPALDVVRQLLSRWRQENYFKYMRQNYDFDALVDYSTEPLEDREIPNPEHQKLTKQLRQARAQLRNLQAQAHTARTDGQPVATQDEINQRLTEQSELVDQLLSQRGELPPRCMLSETDRANEVKLSVDRKLCSDLVKVAAYRTECQLVRRIEGSFVRNADEGHAFIRTAMQQTGQIRVEGENAYVTLEPMSAPRFTRALQALCDAINSDSPRYPETHWRLHFNVRPTEE